MRDRKRANRSRSAWRVVPWALALALALSGLMALHSFGPNWDEALGDLFFGQRYASYFGSLDRRYLDFSANPYPAGFTPDLSMAPFRNRPWEHYPVGSTLATLAARLFSKDLRLLDYFDGFHALNMFLGAILLLLLYRFIERWTNRFVALLTIALLFLVPRVAYHFLVNVKDFPEMVFFSLALMLFFDGYERGTPLRILSSGVVLGLALGTKANALFAPIIAGLFVLTTRIPEPWQTRRRWRVPLLLAAGVVAVVVFIGTWPYLWNDTLHRLALNLRYIAIRKAGTAPQNAANPLSMLMLTTPPAVLAAFALGIVPLYQRVRRRDPLGLLLLSWIAVILARLVVPAAVNFDGVRHFLEIFPPIAAVAAMGVEWTASKVTQHLSIDARPLIAGLIAALFIVPVATTLIRMHPFEVAYWNVLVGGSEGAVERGIPQSGDYWATSYRLGIDWIDRNAPWGSILVVPVAEHTVRIVAPERLRHDIELAHVSNPWSPRLVPGAFQAIGRLAKSRTVIVMFVPRKEWSNELVADCRKRLRPIVSWGIGKTRYLEIYQYRPPPISSRNGPS